MFKQYRIFVSHNLNLIKRLQVSFWSGLDPGLDVGHIADSLSEVGELGELGEHGLVHGVGGVHVDVEVGPGEVVTNKVLASSSGQLLLKLSQSSLKCHISKVLQTSLIFGEVELDPGVDQVLDDINDLVDLGLLEAAVTGKTNLPSNESGGGHGLADLDSVPVKDRKLSKGGGGLKSGPGGGGIPWRSDPVILKLDTTIGQQKSAGLSPSPQVEVGQLDIRHDD